MTSPSLSRRKRSSVGRNDEHRDEAISPHRLPDDAGPGERTYRCERCGLQIDRDLNAALNLAALTQHVAPSGGQTINARSRPVTPSVPRTHVRPGSAGQRVDRVARTTPVGKTGTASEQSKAA